MRVWGAYLRAIRRFFQIEVWSWTPGPTHRLIQGF